MSSRSYSLAEGHSSERLRLELGLWLALVNPALLKDGWRGPIFIRAMERISALAQHLDLREDPQRPVALSMLALTALFSADLERGRQAGELLLESIRTHGPECGQGTDQRFLMLAHCALGQGAWHRGHPAAAREHLERALALHDPCVGLPLSPVMEVAREQGARWF